MIREGVIISERYQIMNRIGTGGMADVYKAIDRKLNRYVAMKVLKREFREDETFVRKFQSEAQSAAGLLHPSIVNVYDVGEDRGLYYIVMELVEGITLKDYIQKKGRLTYKEVISIAVQVCSAMETAHGNNIIHRDIKPQNIMISKEGKVKVTDFGIAKATSSNTISTNVMGSVHYTSPEQARGGYSDAKSDIYSLGITMYEMITGELPFDGDSTVSVALKHLQEDITEPSELVEDIPYSLEQIILKCTQKSPERRYSNITQLEKDLRRSLADPDGDFVVIAPFDASATKMITAEELSRIQKVAAYEDEDDYSYNGVGDEDDYEERRARYRNANKKDIDPKMAKIMKILTIVVSVIFVFILIFVFGKALGIFSTGSGDNKNIEAEDKKVEVPDLVGKTYEEAEKICKKLGFKIVIDDQVESKKYEEGQIDSQRTQAGAKMPKGANIRVVVSSGKLVQVPKLEGKDYIDARDKLIEMGFDKDNIKMEEEPSDKIDEDEVTRTDPAAGEWLAKNGDITIYVSTGIEMKAVPNLVGMTKAEAEAKLAEFELVASMIGEESSTIEKGKVSSQKTAAGTKVEKGSIVEFWISKGEEPKEKKKVPEQDELVGKDISYVKDVLEKDDFFTVDIQFSSYPGCAYGEVVKVQYAGEEKEKGTVIRVDVSNWTGEGTGGNSTN